MRILVNEHPWTVPHGATMARLVDLCKPQADLLILNGFPVPGETTVAEGDAVVLIRRGEIPTPQELDALLAARHTPGVHARLKKACVGIAGCGGLGSNVAGALARVGIGCLILADFDVVEPSNLNRQAYFIDQVGQLKVQALAANLARINPAVHIAPHAVRLTPENIPTLFSTADVLVEAFDRADQKAMLFEAAARFAQEKPVVMGLGMAGFGGNNLLHTRVSGNLYICGDGVAEARRGFGLMAPRVGVVAHLQANQVMEILLGKDPTLEQSTSQRGEPHDQSER